jgi:N-acetyl-anhydromuramyl-L-alanine amidase AmpD
VSTMTRLSLFTLSTVLCLSFACVSENGREDVPYDGSVDGGDDGESQPEEPPEELAAMFEAAAEEFDVPSIILSSVAHVETGWQMVQGSVEFDGQPIATGLMALRGENLQEGAALAGVSLAEASSDPLANIRAGAALLSVLADELGVTDRQDIGAWAPVLAAYSGIEDPDARDAYVYDEVFPIASGSIGLEPADDLGEIDHGGATPEQALAAGPDYAGSVWRPSPNYSNRPAGSAGTPSLVIIHTCEGSYSGCWGWLKNANSGVSAHYVVNNTGSEITQLVEETRKAWHIGASYNCSLNNSVDCGKNGSSSNNFTIGIEHAGYAKQANWDGDLIDASAQLVCDITKDRNIVRDKYHIVAHGQLQPYNRIDPGPNWPWNDYIALIQDYCGNPEPEPEPEPEPPPPPPPPPPEPEPEPDPDPEPVNIDIIIDSNQGLNGANAAVSVSANWTSASGPSDYETGYWWRSTQAVSDAAEFAFYLEAPATLTVEAWWTQGTNRSSTAPYMIYNAASQLLGTVNVDQTQNGGKWNVLGTFDFQAGWNFVDLSAWAPVGKVVIADAVRVHTP